jgi:hypothetical protein
MNLDNLHFCKADKVKYRKHLTVGVMVATVCGFVGTAGEVTWLINLASIANTITAIIWIWE